MFSRSRSPLVLIASSTALTAALAVGVPALTAPAPATAAPSIPDNLPVFSQIQENPSITVTFDDGTPAEGATVHRGDVLLVHGSGFPPQANKGGFPLPVPPGTSNGVFVLYSGFPDQWKPSENADSSTRKHPHDRMAWDMPKGTLDAIPQKPIDMHRSIARQAQPMNDDGTFTARLVVDHPEQTPGTNFGVYTYAGGGSVNPAEELYVPINYSPEPGPNPPPAPTEDLVVKANELFTATKLAQGGVNPKDGAAKQDYAQTVSFSRDRAAEEAANDGIRRYKGSVTGSARFNVVELTVANPWIITLPNGTEILTAETSDGNVGPDSLTRRPIGILSPANENGAKTYGIGPLQYGELTEQQ